MNTRSGIKDSRYLLLALLVCTLLTQAGAQKITDYNTKLNVIEPNSTEVKQSIELRSWWQY